jgi:hypothetical protein
MYECPPPHTESQLSVLFVLCRRLYCDFNFIGTSYILTATIIQYSSGIAKLLGILKKSHLRHVLNCKPHKI